LSFAEQSNNLEEKKGNGKTQVKRRILPQRPRRTQRMKGVFHFAFAKAARAYTFFLDEKVYKKSMTPPLDDLSKLIR